MLNILVPYLEAHSALTAEEQKILDDFKERNPIRTYDDVEKEQGKFQIYQLPGGEKYHGVRFEGLDRLKAEGVQVFTIKAELHGVGLTTAQTPFGHTVPVYDLERTICDLLRSRNNMEMQTFQGALKMYALSLIHI